MENDIPFVNIIILNWNGYKDTIECVESIKKIEYKNWGITLLDNGSKDDSLKKLKKKYGKNKKIKIIPNKSNEGFAKANNQAMEKDLFNADYFLLLNNDTIVKSDFLTQLIKEKKELISPLIYNYYEKKELSKNDLPGKFNLFIGGGRAIKPVEKELMKIDYASGCCWLIKKELFQRTKGFNKDYFAYNEEIEWAYRLKNEGYDFYLNPKSNIWHKGAKTSNKISGLKLKCLNRNIIWFEKKYASKTEYILFLLYLIFYKIPKNLLQIINSREDIKKKINYLFLGLKEGLSLSIKN
jgi:hypothetical protein